MRIQLIDRNHHLCELWTKEFKEYDNVTVHQGDFFGLPTDCVVSPANSFGFMDGGLDGYITNKLGLQVQQKLQDQIARKYEGELLVGQATLVETKSPLVPYLISAPTMRVPMRLPKDTINPYLAMKAMLFCTLGHLDKINTITIPGLGTGVGMVDFEVCARQMRVAYENVIENPMNFPKSWREIQLRHIDLYEPNGKKDLQH
jgi:O-acetyl-ADP-ribose deacetylase (regulator of RNase III)